MTKTKCSIILIGCLRTLLLVILILALGYGILLIIIGNGTQMEINSVKEQYDSVSVQVTELRHSEGLFQSLIVVVKPEDGQNGVPAQLGDTVATTSNQTLSVGDSLTMYYDPNNLQTRVIDFQTAGAQQRTGLFLTGSAFFLLLFFIIWKLISKNRHSHPTAIAGS